MNPDYYRCKPGRQGEDTTFLSGSVLVTLGEETVQVEAGCTLFVPAGVIHGMRNDGREDVHLLAFLATSKPEIIYPGKQPDSVDWSDNSP